MRRPARADRGRQASAAAGRARRARSRSASGWLLNAALQPHDEPACALPRGVHAGGGDRPGAGVALLAGRAARGRVTAAAALAVGLVAAPGGVARTHHAPGHGPGSLAIAAGAAAAAAGAGGRPGREVRAGQAGAWRASRPCPWRRWRWSPAGRTRVSTSARLVRQHASDAGTGSPLPAYKIALIERFLLATVARTSTSSVPRLPAKAAPLIARDASRRSCSRATAGAQVVSAAEVRADVLAGQVRWVLMDHSCSPSTWAGCAPSVALGRGARARRDAGGRHPAGEGDAARGDAERGPGRPHASTEERPDGIRGGNRRGRRGIGGARAGPRVSAAVDLEMLDLGSTSARRPEVLLGHRAVAVLLIGLRAVIEAAPLGEEPRHAAQRGPAGGPRRARPGRRVPWISSTDRGRSGRQRSSVL